MTSSPVPRWPGAASSCASLRGPRRRSPGEAIRRRHPADSSGFRPSLACARSRSQDLEVQKEVLRAAEKKQSHHQHYCTLRLQYKLQRLVIRRTGNVTFFSFFIVCFACRARQHHYLQQDAEPGDHCETLSPGSFRRCLLWSTAATGDLLW